MNQSLQIKGMVCFVGVVRDILKWGELGIEPMSEYVCNDQQMHICFLVFHIT